MIHHVDGTLITSDVGRVIVEVGGVGLELLVPDATARMLPAPGGRVQLLTHPVVREDSWTLFGFASQGERATFRLLLAVQGVGPRLALAVLSTLGTDRLRAEGLVLAREVLDVGKGTPVTVSVDVAGAPRSQFAGEVVFVSPEISPVTGQVRIFADVDNGSGLLRPGLRPKMTILLGKTAQP